MPLIGPKEMFEAAYAGKFAIGAFNVNNMEIIQGITEAAKEENAPLILQVSNFPDDQRYKAVSFRFPSTIRDLRNHSINNTFGDAVFVLVRTTS